MSLNTTQDTKNVVIRTIMVCATCVTALAAYPIAMLFLGTLAVGFYGAYEVILAGILFDALMAPGNGFFGDYRYTSILFILTCFTFGIRLIVRGVRAH